MVAGPRSVHAARMTSVTFDMSMSLDGYVRAANPRPEEPLGEGGEALHAWVMDDDAGREVLERGVAGTGAVICGRATYDDRCPGGAPTDRRARSGSPSSSSPTPRPPRLRRVASTCS